MKKIFEDPQVYQRGGKTFCPCCMTTVEAGAEKATRDGYTLHAHCARSYDAVSAVRQELVATFEELPEKVKEGLVERLRKSPTVEAARRVIMELVNRVKAMWRDAKAGRGCFEIPVQQLEAIKAVADRIRAGHLLEATFVA